MRINREDIDPEADKVVRRLARHGYKAYLVGGCVRDLLLGRRPKDFDVATSATPKDIKQLFRNCRIIGRRFRLAHVFFGSKIIETSTFRANPRQSDEDDSDEILIRRDNVFGTEIEDAQRRDFTMNGLFYDVEAEQVIDHIGGLLDLEARVVATIGDPDIRFREDPVRILRAIKFAARLDFDIEARTLAAAIRHRGEIAKCAPPRVLEEVYRLLRGGAARRSIELLCETGTAQVLSPQLAHLFGRDGRTDDEELPPTSDDDAPEVERRPRLVEAPPARADAEEARWAAVWADDAPLRPYHDEDDELEAPTPAVERVSLAPPPFLGELGDLTGRRTYAYRALGELDVLFAKSVEVTNAFLAALLAAPFVLDDAGSARRPSEVSDRIDHALGPLLAQLQVARRDAERARQIVHYLPRLSVGKRRRGGGPRRDAADEAQLLCDLLAAARGEVGEVPYWEALSPTTDAPAAEPADERGKRRRRRRGGRRRRVGELDASGDDGPPGPDDGDELDADRVEPASA